MHGVARPKWDAVNHKWDQPFLPSVQQYIILLEQRIEELETSRISFYFNNKEISKEKAKELLEKLVQMQMLLLCLSAVSNVATLRNQGSYIRCCGSKHFYYYRSTHDRCCQPPQAIAIGRALEPFNLYFFEDPIEPENMDQWRWVAQQQPIPLAMGERLYTIYQFRNLLNHQGAAYLRPDLSLNWPSR